MPLTRRPSTDDAAAAPHWSELWLPKMMHAIGQLRTSRYSDKWVPQTYKMLTGESTRIAVRNPARERLLIWTDAGNTSPVWIGAAPHNGTDAPSARDGYVALAASSQILTLYTTGDVFAWSSSQGVVYRISEFGRG